LQNMEEALKKQEEKEFKRVLVRLALSVIAVNALTVVVSELIYVWNRSAYFPRFGKDAFYVFRWAANDVAVYLPAIAVYWAVFKDIPEFRKRGMPYSFGAVWLIPLFAAAEAMTRVGVIVSDILEYVLRPIFGGEGLPDVFADIMPQNGFQAVTFFCVAVIVGPICEELIYRRLLLNPLRRYGDMQAVIITALLFGFFHSNFTQFLYAAIGGFILGVTAIRANSVVASIYLHMLINGGSFLLSYFGDSELFPPVLPIYWIFVLLGVILFIIMTKKGVFKLENKNEHLTSYERARILLQNPLILIMTVILIALTFLGTES